MSVEIEFQLTADDFARWAVLGQRYTVGGKMMPTGAAWGVAAACLGAAVYNGVMHGVQSSNTYWWLWSFFCFAFVGLVRYKPFVLSRARKNFASMTGLHAVSHAVFTSDDVTLSMPSVNSTLKWELLDRYVIDEQVLVLLQSSNMAYLFPRRVFNPEGWKTVEGWVRDRLKPA